MEMNTDMELSPVNTISFTQKSCYKSVSADPSAFKIKTKTLSLQCQALIEQ